MVGWTGFESSYDIKKDNIVVELCPGNTRLGSGGMLNYKFVAVILPDTITSLSGGAFWKSDDEEDVNYKLEELKIKGTLTTVPTSGNVRFKSTCKIFYNGNEYNGEEFMNLFN